MFFLLLFHFVFGDELLVKAIFGPIAFLVTVFNFGFSERSVPFAATFAVTLIPLFLIARSVRLSIVTRFLFCAWIWLAIGFFAIFATGSA